MGARAIIRLKPLAIDLFCGLGGWTEGLLAEGYDVIGFDIERHAYGEHCYPARLVIQDIRTLDGAQFKDASLIVASPPCQEYSYMAMPWTRARAKAAAIRTDETGAELARLNLLFNECFRLQREACEAAGRRVPLIVENVRGAQPWVGQARWSFGSFYLWGDVPALMPRTNREAKRPGHDWNRFKETGEVSPHWRMNGADSRGGRKLPGFRFDGSGRSFQSASVDGQKGVGGLWFYDNENGARYKNSKSPARKMASAMIAKIPLALSRHIGRTFHPGESGHEKKAI